MDIDSASVYFLIGRQNWTLPGAPMVPSTNGSPYLCMELEWRRVLAGQQQEWREWRQQQNGHHICQWVIVIVVIVVVSVILYSMLISCST